VAKKHAASKNCTPQATSNPNKHPGPPPESGGKQSAKPYERCPLTKHRALPSTNKAARSEHNNARLRYPSYQWSAGNEHCDNLSAVSREDWETPRPSIPSLPALQSPALQGEGKPGRLLLCSLRGLSPGNNSQPSRNTTLHAGPAHVHFRSDLVGITVRYVGPGSLVPIAPGFCVPRPERRVSPARSKSGVPMELLSAVLAPDILEASVLKGLPKKESVKTPHTFVMHPQ